MAKLPTQSFTDTKRVKELIALMAENGLTEIELVEDKSKITLKRGTVAIAAPAVHAAVAHPAPAHTPPAAPSAPTPAATPEEKLIPIKSPMVGTFYSRPNPDSPAFVTVGSAIGEDSVVCIIEAMKVFNEIRSEVSGTVVKVLIQNGQAVEFGQPMFMVKQA